MNLTSPRNRAVVISGLVLILLAAVISLTGHSNSSKHIQAVMMGRQFRLELADTEAEREQGLSGRSRLNKDEGMLFVFDQSGKQCMWMKDMRFSLDMVWLDEQKKVVNIRKNISPDTYPESFCAPGKYVLEANVGTVDNGYLAEGQQLTF